MCDSELKQQPLQEQQPSVKPETLPVVTLHTQLQQQQQLQQAPEDSPLGHTKLAHQFWFSYPPPGAGGGSSNSKTSQTDEEKQRDRQRCEREAKKEEQDALNYKRDKESKEARLLDFEIRRQQEREKKKEEHKQQHQQIQQPQQQQQQQQQQQLPSEKSPPTTSGQAQQQLAQQQQQLHQEQVTEQEQQQELVASSSAPTPIVPTPPDRTLPPAFRSHSIERENLYQRKRQFSTVEALELKKPQSTTPSPQALTGPTPTPPLPLPQPPTPITSVVVAGPQATAAAATAAIIPILPLGVATLRDDSTESEEQSVTCTHAHGEACHRIILVWRNNIKGTPTVLPAQNLDPVKDAHDLRKAMKGFGTDEDALINIICRRSNEQRQEIQRQYKTHFGKDLIEDIKSETSGNFEKLLVGLLRPIVDFYCCEMNDAMAGIGTDEDVLIEILCTLSNHEIHTIKNQYLRLYGAHLESELKSETSGNFKRLLVSLCTAARDESGQTNREAAQSDARELLKAGELRVGTDESMFNMILCQRNYQQLKLIFQEYEHMTGHSLANAIKKEFSGDIMEGLIAIYRCCTNKAEYFASRLHKSMAGIGTNDKQLIRVIVTRSEIDMVDIKAACEHIYGKSLKSWIKGDTSGHYKHALYALIGEQRSNS